MPRVPTETAAASRPGSPRSRLETAGKSCCGCNKPAAPDRSLLLPDRANPARSWKAVPPGLSRPSLQFLAHRKCTSIHRLWPDRASNFSKLERKPDDPVAHLWYARFLASQNRTDEALAEGRRALEADPLSLTARRELLNLLFAARRYDETIAEALLLDINPAFPDVHLGIVWIYLLQGNAQPAFEAFLEGLQGLGVTAPLLEQARQTFQQGGMPAILRQWVELLERNAALGEKNQFDLIILHSLLGDRDRCFELLESLRRQEHPLLFWLPAMPVFDNLRTDPRYSRLLVQLGFPQPFPNQ